MRARPPGITLIEIVVATTLGTLICGFIVATLNRQQRFYAAASAQLSARAQLRDAANILTSDIRSAAVSSYGLPLMTDSAVEMITTIASSVLCEAPSGGTLRLPPAILANGNTLTSILAQPDDDDAVIMYGSPSSEAQASGWERASVLTFASRPLADTCPPASGFTTAADAALGTPGYTVTVTPSPGAAIRRGAPVRFLRRVRYSLYRSSDSRWYLGYRRCTMAAPVVCAGIQPVSGPYNTWSSRSNSGLVFRYFDDEDTEVDAAAGGQNVARIEIVLRSPAGLRMSSATDGRRMQGDSTAASVSPRDRAR